jgi:hypothetical protein
MLGKDMLIEGARGVYRVASELFIAVFKSIEVWVRVQLPCCIGMATSHGYRVDPALGSCTDDTVRTAFSGCINGWTGWAGKWGS